MERSQGDRESSPSFTERIKTGVAKTLEVLDRKSPAMSPHEREEAERRDAEMRRRPSFQTDEDPYGTQRMSPGRHVDDDPYGTGRRNPPYESHVDTNPYGTHDLSVTRNVDDDPYGMSRNIDRAAPSIEAQEAQRKGATKKK